MRATARRQAATVGMEIRYSEEGTCNKGKGADGTLPPTPAGTLKVTRNAHGKHPRHAVKHPPAAAAFGRRRRGVLAGVSGSPPGTTREPPKKAPRNLCWPAAGDHQRRKAGHGAATTVPVQGYDFTITIFTSPTSTVHSLLIGLVEKNGLVPVTPMRTIGGRPLIVP